MSGIKGIQKGISFTRFALENPDRLQGGVRKISRGGTLRSLFSEKPIPNLPLPQGVKAQLARA